MYSVSHFDLEPFLSEISSEAPCGEDISYDNAFLELERLTQGTEEIQVGDHIQASEDPDWKKVYSESIILLERSRDLRLILYFTVSKLSLEGLPGFYDGLALLRASVERYWDHLFPQLDPDDDYDPMERMNIIGSLSPPQTAMSDEDTIRIISRLMNVPLCKPNDVRLPQPSLRHILAASGEFSVSEMEAKNFPSKQLIDAAFEQVDIKDLQSTDQILQGCIEHLRALDQTLMERVGAAMAPNFSRLEQLLKQMRMKVGAYMEHRGYSADESFFKQTQRKIQTYFKGEQSPTNPNHSDAKVEPSIDGAFTQALSGQITSNKDILKALDMIIAYYERNEPSSPVPLLLKRAKSLVGLNFVDIIRNLSPDAMSQVQVFSGEEEPTDN